MEEARAHRGPVRLSRGGGPRVHRGPPRVAVLSPYFPYPLSHGGAVRIYNLLREIAKQFDVELFAFTDGDAEPETAPVLEFCARVVLVDKPRYREPRWSTLLPPEVHEFRSPAMRQALAEERRAFGFELLQVEYTQLAEYGGDILVEHDVTFDLFGQIARRERTLSMVGCLPLAALRVRSAPLPAGGGDVAERRRTAGPRGSHRDRGERSGSGALPRRAGSPGRAPAVHRLLPPLPQRRGLPLLHRTGLAVCARSSPQMTLTVVCGADRSPTGGRFADSPEPPPDERIRMLGFVADVRPLYVEANLVLAPTTVSAGTNVKVLEAMAMRRAVVSTSCGCAGLGLLHGHSVGLAIRPSLRRRRCDADHRSRSAGADRAGGPRPRGTEFRLGSDRRESSERCSVGQVLDLPSVDGLCARPCIALSWNSDPRPSNSANLAPPVPVCFPWLSIAWECPACTAFRREREHRHHPCGPGERRHPVRHRRFLWHGAQRDAHRPRPQATGTGPSDR